MNLFSDNGDSRKKYSMGQLSWLVLAALVTASCGQSETAARDDAAVPTGLEQPSDRRDVTGLELYPLDLPALRSCVAKLDPTGVYLKLESGYLAPNGMAEIGAYVVSFESPESALVALSGGLSSALQVVDPDLLLTTFVLLPAEDTSSRFAVSVLGSATADTLVSLVSASESTADTWNGC